MHPWEVIYGDARSDALERRLLAPDDVGRWGTDPDPAIVVVAPPDYAAEIADVLGGPRRPPKPPQHAGRGLATYVPAVAGVRHVRGKYTRAGTLESGVRALVQSREFRRWQGVFLLEADAGVVGDLLRRIGPAAVFSEEAGAFKFDDVGAFERAVDAEVGPVSVPPSLLNAFVGRSTAADSVRRAVVKAARTNHPVLILGETGTGKEVVARQIHALSPRAVNGHFVVVNCAAIASDLLETELFGHVQGAFTGAYRDKVGLYATANNGTLFLDEIGDMSPVHQAKMLRVLEDGRYRPVGANEELKSNVRVVAATCKDLLRLVRSGRFRDDLYYRLQSLRIYTLALRDHAEDVPALALHFWPGACESFGRFGPLTDDVLSVLSDHPWNGNARELRAFLADLATNLEGRRPTAALVRMALRVWQRGEKPRDRAWDVPLRERDR